MANIRERTITRSSSKSGRWVFLGIVILLFAAITAFGVVYYQKYNQLNKMTATEFSSREKQKVLDEVAKLYTLPTDESPLQDAIKSEDIDKLKEQYAFFKDAAVGDVYVIYQKGQLALIYRPSTKQLVKVGPLSFQNAVNIGIIGTDAERGAVSQKLTENQLAGVDKGSAKGNYKGITVVDISGQKPEEAKNLAELVGGQVGTMPDGENKPEDVDLLIIAGPNGS